MTPSRTIAVSWLVSLVLVLPAVAAGSSGEHPLAAVRELQEKIRGRLGRPLEALDLDLIMEGPDFYGTLPFSVRWDSDGSRLWFEWKRWHEEDKGTFEYQLGDGSLRRLAAEEAERVPPVDAVWDAERRRALWAVDDRVWLYDGDRKESRPLVEGIGSAPPPSGRPPTSGSEMAFFNASSPFPEQQTGSVEPVTFSAEGDRAVVFFDQNLYALTLPRGGEAAGPTVAKLTELRQGARPQSEPPTEPQRLLQEKQRKLFDVLDRRTDRRARETADRRQGALEPLYLDGWKLGALLPSPDLGHAIVVLYRDPPAGRETVVPDFVTASGYTEDLPSYRLIGDDGFESKTGVIDLASGRVSWVDFGLEGRDREHLFFYWHPDGERAVGSIGSLDGRDRWLVVVEPAAEAGGAVAARVVAHEHDDAWIGFATMTYFGWIPGGEEIWFVSERSGWMHLWAVSAAGGEPRALTRGDYLVLRPGLMPDGEAMIFGATGPDPFEMQSYLLPLPGGEPRRVTAGQGRAEAFPSPDGSSLAVLASGANRPWELYVKALDDPGPGKRITASPSPAFESYPWIEPRIVYFEAEDGTPIPARLFEPAKPHPERPAVIFAHGAGWLHNVHRWWSSYSREYCFHHLLMERGYTVLDVDFRGSAGYGRDWRTAATHEMPVGKVSDLVDGARYLVREHGAAFDRIGIYGGSGGGMLTLMALFTAGDYFGAGAALRSVPDIAHHHASIQLLSGRDPLSDPEYFVRASPIYFAEGLQDPLLICHGVVDRNAHLGDVMRLVQRLIELRKTDWELALYPVEGHGFLESASWVDEYRRILDLFERHLKTPETPPGPEG